MVAAEGGMHLIVTHHGLWGKPEHLNTIVKFLAERHAAEEHSDDPADAVVSAADSAADAATAAARGVGGSGVRVVNISCNASMLTYDGVDVCGERAVKFLETAYLATANPPTKISFVGYSMGGLICRYMVGRLYVHGYFDQVKPVNFVTFATPHLGAAKPPTSLYNKAFTAVASYYAQRAGAQMMLDDSYLARRPLLEVMSDPGSPFMKGLAAFQRRAVYANCFHDRMVPYPTAAIRTSSPYAAPDVVPLPADPKYPCIVQPRPRAEAGRAADRGSGAGGAGGGPGEGGDRAGTEGADEGAALAPKDARLSRTALTTAAVLSPVLLPTWLLALAGFGLYGALHVAWRNPGRLAVRDWLQMHGYVLEADGKGGGGEGADADAEALQMAAELAMGAQEAAAEVAAATEGLGVADAQAGASDTSAAGSWRWRVGWPLWGGGGACVSGSDSDGGSSVKSTALSSQSSSLSSCSSSPADRRVALMARMAGGLDSVSWERYDVDTGHLHSHGAIVMRRPAYHTGCEDVMHHFTDTLIV